jgi:hypothetical protein
VFLKGKEILPLLPRKNLRVFLKGKEVLPPGKIVVSEKQIEPSVEAYDAKRRKKSGPTSLPDRLDRCAAHQPRRLPYLNVRRMTFALARASRPERMTFKEVVKAARTHASFLRMMGKGHLQKESKTRMFWDYIGDMFDDRAALENFVFMRDTVDLFSSSSVRLALTLVCLLETQTALTVPDYADCFFNHNDCVAHLERIDPEMLLSLSAVELFGNEIKSKDAIYDLLESFCPFNDKTKKYLTGTDLWGALCDFSPLENKKTAKDEMQYEKAKAAKKRLL